MQQDVQTTDIGIFTSFVEPIANFGILIIIASIFLVATIICLKKFIGTYTQTVDKTINDVIPKLDEVSKSILELNACVNEMLSTHNTHVNQSFKTISKDTDDLKDTILSCQNSLMNLESEIKSLKTEYETIIKFMIKDKN